MDTWFDKLGGLIKKPPLKDSLHKFLDPSDPRLCIRPMGNDWLCPYTGVRIETPNWDGNPVMLLNVPEIHQHLLNLPILKSRGAKAPMKSLTELTEIVIRPRLAQYANYRQYSDKGEWICPYCLSRTSVTFAQWDGTEEPLDLFLPQALTHLRSCAAYLADPFNGRSVEEIRDSFGDDAARVEILKSLRSDPRFNVWDDTGAWICPFTQHAIETIRLPKLTSQSVDINAIVRHLLDPKQCPAHYSQWRVESSLEDLRGAAIRISEKRKAAMSQAASEKEMGKLREHAAQATSAVTEMQRELEAARQAQMKMLPAQPPQIEGYEIAAFYESCVELSGDLFHFLDAGPGSTGFVVGDVSGHGVEAAMVMSAALKSFWVRGKGVASPSEVMAGVNDDLHKDLNRGKFVTAFYAVLDHATGKLTYSRAGHNPGLLITPGQPIQELKGAGLALGIADDVKYRKAQREYETVLAKGSLFVLYTDGIVEAMNAQEVELGDEQFQHMLVRYAELPVLEIAAKVRLEVIRHIGDQPISDDLTMVILKRL